MLQAYRVRETFEAKQLRREPLWMEPFEEGELLILMSSEDGENVFCRHEDPDDIEERDHFVMAVEEFLQVTDEHAGSQPPDSEDESSS